MILFRRGTLRMFCLQWSLITCSCRRTVSEMRRDERRSIRRSFRRRSRPRRVSPGVRRASGSSIAGRLATVASAAIARLVIDSGRSVDRISRYIDDLPAPPRRRISRSPLANWSGRYAHSRQRRRHSVAVAAVSRGCTRRRGGNVNGALRAGD